MNPKYRPVAALVLAGAVFIALSGCSSSKKSTNTGSLTKDQQYAMTESLMVSIVPLTVGQFGTGFWDGVDANDFSPQNIAPFGMGKLATVPDSVSYRYDIARGWWIIYARVSVSSNPSETGQVMLRDSVRFETQSGRAQVSPNDSTYRVRNGSSIAMNMQSANGDSASLGLEISASTAVDVTGLNTSVRTVNGSTSASFGLGVVAGANSADVGFNLDASISNVTVETASGNHCPTGGAMTVNLDMSVNVVKDGKHDSANGQWDVQVGFTGGGSADFDVHSGDFHAQNTAHVCD